MKEPYSAVRPSDYDLYSCPDAVASEWEVCDFIGALVWAAKPKHVVEIGTYRGHTTVEIGKALARIGRGWCNSFEVQGKLCDEARERCAGLPVEVHRSDGALTDAGADWVVDMLFIDGNLDNRLAIFRHWWDRVPLGGYILVHDTLKYPQVMAQVHDMEKYLGRGTQRMDLDTPRGLTVLRRFN